MAWNAAFISAGASGLIGLCAAVSPASWIGLFSRDTDVLRVGVDYLHRAAPFYAFYGFGMALYFASQGTGEMVWPVVANLSMPLKMVLAGTPIALRASDCAPAIAATRDRQIPTMLRNVVIAPRLRPSPTSG